jgi:hypothetical protein
VLRYPSRSIGLQGGCGRLHFRPIRAIVEIARSVLESGVVLEPFLSWDWLCG